MKDVVLIQLPNPFLAHPLMYPTSLGVLYIAATLEQAGVDVGIADLRGEVAVPELASELVPVAHYYGFSFTTGESSDAKRIARALKAQDPYCVTIAGGAHPSVLPGDCAPFFDFVVVGEGERILPQIVSSSRSALEVRELMGVNDLHPFLRSSVIEDLNKLPFPARHLVPDTAFSSTLMPGERHGSGGRAAMIISSRGCPQVPACAFCANPFPSPVRFRSPENVVLEVSYLKQRYGIAEFRDEADNLTCNKKWLLQYCKLLDGMGVHWKGHTRADYLDEDEVVAMKQAGLIELAVGCESADPAVLELTNKRESVDQYADAVSLLKKHKVISKVYFMSGLPGETANTLRLNKEFFFRVKPDKWSLLKFTPLPGCEVWNNPSKFGARISADFREFNFWHTGTPVTYNGADGDELEARYREMLRFLASNEWR